MTREEILGLSKLSEGEQRNLLASNGILKQTVQEFAGSEPRALVYYESLPDLADRLWREAVDTLPAIKINNSILSVWRENDPHKVEFGDDRHDVEEAFRWLLLFALPIHRIQAALLAKEGV